MNHSLGRNDVLKLRDELVARGRVGAEIRQGVRTELSGLLELACPLPAESDVRVEHHAEADAFKRTDPNHTTTHHYIQKRHAMAIWAEVDRLVAEAGL